MTTPTLALGISAAGAQQVADLAAAVAALKNNLVQLGQTAGGNSLGSLDKLTSEFQQMRQEMVQAVQGLRTDLAAGFNQAFTAAALQVKAGGSKVEDEVKASAARIKSASKEMDLGNAMLVATDKYRAIQERQIADTIAFEEKQKTAWVSYQQALNKRLADEARAMDVAVVQFRSIQAQQIADQEKQLAREMQLEAAYQTLSKQQQLRQQMQARSMLDQGVTSGALGGRFAPSAISNAEVTVMSALRAEVTNTSHAMDELGFASVRAKKEIFTLGDEAVQGRWRNFGGSLLVLARQAGLAGVGLSAMGLAVAAAVAPLVLLATATEQGDSELKKFENAVTMTGDSIGMTNTQFGVARDTISSFADVTKGKAAEALTAIAANGKLAGADITSIGEAAVLMQKATGQALDKTIAQFAELEHAPVSASAKLNEQYNYLTASVYQQIKALHDQGKEQEAVTLAQKVFADEIITRSKSVVENVGYMEAAWHLLRDAAKEAWDTMVSIGRTPTNGEQIDTLRQNLARQQELNRDTLHVGDANGDTPHTMELKVQIDLLKENDRMEQKLADSQKDRAELTRINEERLARLEANRPRAMKEQQEIDRITIEDQKLINAGLMTEEQMRTDLAQIREKYAKKGGGGATRAGTITGQSDVADAQTALYQGLMDTNNTTQVSQLTNAEKQLITINDQLKTATDASKKSQLEAAAAAAEAAIPHEKLAQEVKNQYDNWIKDIAQTDASTKANDKSAESIRNKVEQLQQQNATLGKSKTAIEEANLAEYQRQLREAEASDTFDPKYVASLRNKIAAEQDYVKELSETELHLASVKLAEDARAAGEETKTLQLQASLLGQTVEQRNVILAQRKAEVDLAKQLAEIDKINTNGDPAKEAEKQAARQQAIDTARVKSVNAADKTILDEWQKNSDSIEKSLENALVTGFNSGKGMATSLKDWIKKEFESLAIKFLLEPMIAPFSSQLAGQMMQLQGQNLSFGGGTLGGGSGLNLNSFSNIGGSFSNMGSGISNSISGLFGASSIATSTGSSILEGGSAGIVDSSAAGYAGLDAAGASSLGGGASVMGGAAMSGVSSAIPYVGALYAASQGKYGAAAGMAIGTMIMPGIGTIVGAIIGSLLDGKGGGPKQDGTSAGYVGPLGSGDRSTANDVAATAISSNLQSQFDSLVSAGGGTSNLQFGAGYSMDPKGTSPTFLDIMATQGKGGATAYDNLNLSVGRSDAEFQKAITDMSNKALLDGLQKANIEGSLANYLNGLGLIANMTAADAQTAVTKVETALTQKASIDDKIFDLTHTQEEILTKNRTAELKTIDDTNQALQKRLYALQDEATAAQTLISAVQAAGQMIASVNNSIRAYLDKLNATPAGMLTPAEQLGNAKLQFEQQLTLARAGDQTALQGITGYGDQLITAQKGYSASGTDTSKTIDYVKQQLVGLPQMQTTEQQLALIAQNTSNTTSVMKDAGDKIWDGLWGSSGALATEFNQLDLDTSGNLNFNELKNAVGPLATDATLRALIARVDANGDGQISKLEAIGASIPETTANAAITAANVVTTPVPTPPPPAPQPFGPDAKEVAYGAQVPSGYHYAGTSGGKYYVVPGAPPETYNGFAGGGVMSSLGALPLHTYARGGVATSAQMAIFGEGSMNEAYVPLPDGRSIPVSMGGQGALIAEIKALRAEVARLRQIAQTGNQIAAMGAKGTINAVGEVANNTSGALAAAKLARAAAPVGKAAKV